MPSSSSFCSNSFNFYLLSFLQQSNRNLIINNFSIALYISRIDISRPFSLKLYFLFPFLILYRNQSHPMCNSLVVKSRIISRNFNIVNCICFNFKNSSSNKVSKRLTNLCLQNNFIIFLIYYFHFLIYFSSYLNLKVSFLFFPLSF